MKKLIFITVFAALLACGCSESGYFNESDISADETSNNEESVIPPEEIFDFLSSKYHITAKNESMGNSYEYVYYFKDGIVVGTKITSTFPSESVALSYAKVLRKDNAEYIYTHSNTVTVYYDEEHEAYYNGYSLEKLKFVLDRIGYEYTVEFDEDDFYAEFSDISNE